MAFNKLNVESNQAINLILVLTLKITTDSDITVTIYMNGWVGTDLKDKVVKL